MEHRKQADNIERRAYASGLEVRNSTTGTGSVIRGYAARFGSPYEMWDRNIGTFVEEVGRDAFKNADLSDVRVLLNHDPNQILGRTKSGTARVGIDENGLWYEADLPESAVSIREAITRGDIDQSSWGFTLSATGGDKWEVRGGKKYRMLVAVDTVFDASPVTFPANPDTSVAKRSFEVENRAMSSDEERWIIGYLIDNSAWAISRSNDMIGALNNWIVRYSNEKDIAGMESVFAKIVEDCNNAKTALVALMAGHLEAISKLNQNENRGTEPAKQADTEIEIQAALLKGKHELLKLSL